MAVAVDDHTVIVGEDGCVFACGDGRFGQLGKGDTTGRLAPTRITGLPLSSGPVRQVATGLGHTAIVTEAGDLFTCGHGWRGQLGLGDHQDRATPTLVPRAEFFNDPVLMVACGAYKTVVATEGGAVYLFGFVWEDDNDDQDDQEEANKNYHLAPMRVPAVAFRPNGSPEGPGERIVMVAAGYWHMVALSEAGHVFTWGQGQNGQLGHGDEEDQLAPRQVEPGRFVFSGQGEPPDRVAFVAAGKNCTVAVTARGRLYTWGDNEYGQLGHGDTDDRLVPTLVYGFGSSEGVRVVMASCGFDHTLVVTQDGALWACGYGRNGQLGFNHRSSRFEFRRVVAFGGAKVVTAAAGSAHSAAVTEDGALWTWGYNNDGRLGHRDTIARGLPTRVPQASLDGLRIGRCRVLPRNLALAFQISMRGRQLFGKEELLQMIVGWCATVLPGLAGRMEGLMRLCGGFHAWKQRRAAAGQ
jgi:alpha-tubulin suppressor-like RCC1 family protein